MTDTHRWNIEVTQDGIRLCAGEHHRSHDCEWIEYVPKVWADKTEARLAVAERLLMDIRGQTIDAWDAQHVWLSRIDEVLTGASVSADDNPPTCKWCGKAFYSEGEACRTCVPAGAIIDSRLSTDEQNEVDAKRYRWLRERINWRDIDESSGAFSVDPLRYLARHWTHSDVRLPSMRPRNEHIEEYIDGQLAADSAGVSHE